MIGNENLFLIVLGFIWIFGAILQDMKRREVDNLWNFSLIFFALAYRCAFSIFSGDYWFTINGFLGVALFLFLGNLFYYSNVFGGGDAKLLIALGAILPLSSNWIINFKLFGWFLFFILVGGSIYVCLWAFVLALRNLRRFLREFSKQWRRYKNLFFVSFILFMAWAFSVYVLGQSELILVGLIILLFPLLFVFAKAVEESCMINCFPPMK